jgi:hypothetical protein
MSYSIHAYRVDIDKVRNIFASRRFEIIPPIEEIFREELEFYNEEAQDLFGDDTITVNDALKEILEGVFSQDKVWQYAVALEFLCEYLGKRLQDDEYDALHGAGLGIFAEIEPISSLVFDSGSPIAIPLLGKDQIQSIGHLTYEEIVQRLRNLEQLVFEDEDKEWKQALYRQYQEWLRSAFNAKEGIITFL